MTKMTYPTTTNRSESEWERYMKNDENQVWHASLVKSTIDGHAERMERRAAIRAVLNRVTKKLLKDNPQHSDIVMECVEGIVDELRRNRDAAALAARKVVTA